MQYREETFLQFAKKTRLPFFFGWTMNICFIAMTLLLLFQTFKGNIGAIVVGILFLAIGFLGLKGFLYGVKYKLYSAGRKVYKDLGNTEKSILVDIGINIKGFDLWGQSKMFPPSISKTIYDFNSADIILAKQSLILLGKTTLLGGDTYASPVEITNGVSATNLTRVTVNKWTESYGRLELEIQDPNYKKPITIQIKTEVNKIKLWLTTHLQ